MQDDSLRKISSHKKANPSHCKQSGGLLFLWSTTVSVK